MSRNSAENKDDQTADEHQRNLVQLIKKFSYGHHLHTVFADFVESCATSISNAVDQQQFQAREKRYMEIVGKYSRDEVGLFPQMLAELTLSLERRVANMREAARHCGSTAGLTDVLGETYMLLELGNARAGQFFTPYRVSKLMATMMIGDGGSTVREEGFMRLQEPACGAGGMVIAVAESLHDAGLNFQQAIHATCIDIDPCCVHMAYVQLLCGLFGCSTGAMPTLQ
jgi:type I restriction-modification system DNA methylase subunit